MYFNNLKCCLTIYISFVLYLRLFCRKLFRIINSDYLE